MNVTRYTDGSATVVVTNDLEAFVRRLITGGAAAAVEVIEREAEEVRAKASAAWYSQVERVTGQSGQLAVVTTVDSAKSEVRISVGSTDTRRDKRGRPAVAFIHRPRALSTVAREIPEGEYWRIKGLGGVQAGLVFHARYDDPASKVKAGLYYRKVGNPQASDGKVLLQELIRKPMKAKIAQITPEIAKKIAARVNNGR